jgi:DNA modification methylase
MTQEITDRYAAYNGDCIEVMSGMKDASVDLTIYSPPFGGLYTYSSNERDLSNCLNREEFFEHYAFVVQQIHRLTKPGRMSAVHCTDIPTGNSGLDHLIDLPGEIIRLHEANGFKFVARYHIWKEPLTVRNRTMTKSLSHKNLTVDSTRCSIANADQLVIFRRSGVNAVPVAHPTGLHSYAGETKMPADVLAYKNWKGSQLENRFSHWIWRHYASAFWHDIRLDRVLPFRGGKDSDDERHVHPLQLDVIERACVMWSNPCEIVLTPFMGVGSEVFGSVLNGRKAIGIELKETYYRQALKNLEAASAGVEPDEESLFNASVFEAKEEQELAPA